jgi:hypothetical protein
MRKKGETTSSTEQEMEPLDTAHMSELMREEEKHTAKWRPSAELEADRLFIQYMKGIAGVRSRMAKMQLEIEKDKDLTRSILCALARLQG